MGFKIFAGFLKRSLAMPASRAVVVYRSERAKFENLATNRFDIPKQNRPAHRFPYYIVAQIVQCKFDAKHRPCR